MANVKITELTDIGTPAQDDVLEIVDISGNVSRKVKVSALTTTTPTPNLQEVTDVGATTDNNITVNAAAGDTIIGGGYIALKSDLAAQSVLIKSDLVDTVYTAQMPDKTSDDTFAMLSDIVPTATGKYSSAVRNCVISAKGGVFVPNGTGLDLKSDVTISYAEGTSNAFGDINSVEKTVTPLTFPLIANTKNYFYITKGLLVGSTITKPTVGTQRESWGVLSPSNAFLRTTATHTTDISSSGTATASGNYTTYFGWRAFDKQTLATGVVSWSVAAIANCWLQYQNTETRILKSWRIRTAGDNAQIPKNLLIQGSQDGIAWTDIDTTYQSTNFVGGAATLWSNLQQIPSNNTAFLYHRLFVIANNGNATYTTIAELEFNSTKVFTGDYYDVGEGIMYDVNYNPISRVYVGEADVNASSEILSATINPYAVKPARITNLNVFGNLNGVDGQQSSVTWGAGAQVVDWNNIVVKVTASGTITLTDTNLPTSPNTKIIERWIKGNATISLPSGWTAQKGNDAYSVTVMNRLIIECTNLGGTENIVYTLKNMNV